METSVFFNLKLSFINVLAFSASFEYLCYESTAIIGILIISVQSSGTSKDGPVPALKGLTIQWLAEI